MKKYLGKTAVASLLFAFGLSSAQSALISVSGGPSSAGALAEIIAAPSDVRDDAAFNNAIQGFDEVQAYLLLNDITVDSGIITAGTTVSSHMLFLNSGPGNDGTLIEHGAGGNDNAVTFLFDNIVLGVMSNSNGSLEANTSAFLGASGTIYPTSNLGARGLEGNPQTGGTSDDWYSVSGSQISLGMRVTEPGDWIRVITLSNVSTVEASAAPTFALFGLAFAGLGLYRRKL